MNLIQISQILFYVSFFIWLLPPIRNYKERLFYFFLVLALTDIFSFILRYSFGAATASQLLIIPNYLLLVSLVNKETLRKYKYLFLLGLIISFSVIFIHFIALHSYTIRQIMLVIILFMVLKILVVEYGISGKIKIFYLVLLFYQLTNILKYLNIWLGFADATAFFIITSIFQIAFGLFFSIFRENNSRLVL